MVNTKQDKSYCGRYVFVRYASQLVKEGVSLLRWVTIIFLCLYMGKRALQLEHWARSAMQFYIISTMSTIKLLNTSTIYTQHYFPYWTQ